MVWGGHILEGGGVTGREAAATLQERGTKRRGSGGNFQNVYVLQSYCWYYILYAVDMWGFRNTNQ